MNKNFKHQTVAWRPALRDEQSVRLELQIDADDLLAWLGAKALKSRRGYSQIASGAVRVKVAKNKKK